MAKKKAGRRTGGRSGSQPHPNQSAGSSSNTAQASQTQETPALPRVQILRIIPTGQAGAQQDVPSQAVAANELDMDYLTASQIATSRRRPTDVRRIVRPQSNVEPYHRTGDYSSDLGLDPHLRYMFGRLHAAIHDPNLDFYAILAEIRATIATPPTAPPVSEHDWDAYSNDNEEDPGEYGDDWLADDAAPVYGGDTTFQISPADEEHFPAIGASRQLTEGGPSRSVSWGPRMRWATVHQTSPAQASPPAQTPPPAPPTFTLAAAVPTVQHTRRNNTILPPPKSPPPTVRATALSLADLQRLAEDASVLLELYSKSASGPDDDESMQELITSAFAHVSTIHRNHRVAQNAISRAAQKRPEAADFSADTGCIICYSEIADTVLLPCHHLVLCGVRISLPR